MASTLKMSPWPIGRCQSVEQVLGTKGADTGMDPALRIGIDLGGTKIAGIVLDASGKTRARARADTPRDDYQTTLESIRALIHYDFPIVA